jgi:two-component system OmpR family sensor kinase
MKTHGVTVSGLVVALVGFVLTRFTVTIAATDTAVGFLFAGLIPLVLGLGLSAAGVFLAVGTYDRQFVRTIAGWCLVGTGAMGVLVVLTLLGAEVRLTDAGAVREQAYLSTFLIGGAVGGSLTGVYAGRNRCYRRDLREQANRLVVLNRLLRERVVNSATAIGAHQQILEHEHSEDSVAVIDDKVDEIVDTVDQVKHLAETGDRPDGPVDLVASVRRELSTLREAHPEATFSADTPETVEVRATDRVGEILRHLLVNGVVHSDNDHPHVAVCVETTAREATVQVSDDGPGLPERQQALLERGEIAEYDDPTTGFGLNVVRLLAERFDGRLRTAVDETGTTVELTLPRAVDERSGAGAGAEAEAGAGPGVSTGGAGVHPSRAGVAVGAALSAGLAMAAAMAVVGDDLLAIGALYGIETPAVTLVTHEFHSVVFGLTYAGVLAVLSTPRRWTGRLAVGLVFGLSLWLFAAGLVMPLWLGLVGVPASVPNLTLSSLAGHITWAVTVSLGYHAGDRLLDGVDLPDIRTLLPGGSRSDSPGGELTESK